MDKQKENMIDLRINIFSFVEKVLEKALKEDSLDYFQIEVSNHNGNLQLDHKFRDRKKVY